MKRRDFLSSSVMLMAATGLARSRFARAAESADVPAVSRTGGAIVLTAADIDDVRAHQREIEICDLHVARLGFGAMLMGWSVFVK